MRKKREWVESKGEARDGGGEIGRRQGEYKEISCLSRWEGGYTDR